MLARNELGSGFTTAVHDRPDIAELLPKWADLCLRSLEDNVYYAPHYALALLETVDRNADVRLVTVWRGDTLVALLPVVVNRLPLLGLRPAGGAWLTDYTFSCMPLLDRNCPLEAALGLLDGLAQLKRGDWIIPQINAEGPVCRALIEALDHRGVPRTTNGTFQRASIKTGKSFEDHMKEHVGAKRRREFARNRRRLEELGTVVHQSHGSGPALANAVEAFLKIEASGWKGQRGTALASKPETTNFARRAFAAEVTAQTCRADLLLLDGKPIAAGLTVFSGQTGFTVKCAYDEAYASYGTGLLLEVEVVKSFLTERWAERLDAATNGVHAIDRLWPDRLGVTDLVFSFAPIAPQARLAAYKHVQVRISQTKSLLKRLLRR